MVVGFFHLWQTVFGVIIICVIISPATHSLTLPSDIRHKPSYYKTCHSFKAKNLSLNMQDKFDQYFFIDIHIEFFFSIMCCKK